MVTHGFKGYIKWSTHDSTFFRLVPIPHFPLPKDNFCVDRTSFHNFLFIMVNFKPFFALILVAASIIHVIAQPLPVNKSKGKVKQGDGEDALPQIYESKSHHDHASIYIIESQKKASHKPPAGWVHDLWSSFDLVTNPSSSPKSWVLYVQESSSTLWILSATQF